MVQQADDVHAALRLLLEVTGSARPHTLMSHQGALAQQLHSVQIHVCCVENQLDFAKRALAQSSHNELMVHEGDALKA